MARFMNLAVLVPVLDELGEVSSWLRHAASLLPGATFVVCDGGSRDGTAEAVRRLSDLPHKRAVDVPLEDVTLVLIPGPPGRGPRLQAAAQKALESSAVTHLLAVRVETALTRTAVASIDAALADPAFSWGWFDLRLDGPGVAERLLARGISLRARLLGRPIGEQLLLMERSIYGQAGGYGGLPVFEDVELVRRLCRTGRGKRLDGPVVGSGRRYRSQGHLAAAFHRWTARQMWRMGKPAEELVKRYESL